MHPDTQLCTHRFGCREPNRCGPAGYGGDLDGNVGTYVEITVGEVVHAEVDCRAVFRIVEHGDGAVGILLLMPSTFSERLLDLPSKR